MVGWEAVDCVDYLITRGERAAVIAEAARQAGLPATRIIVTSTHEDAARAARDLIEKVGDNSGGVRELEEREADTSVVGAINRPLRRGAPRAVVLIKGSEESRMKRRCRSRYGQRKYHTRPVLLLEVRRCVRAQRLQVAPE